MQHRRKKCRYFVFLGQSFIFHFKFFLQFLKKIVLKACSKNASPLFEQVFGVAQLATDRDLEPFRQPKKNHVRKAGQNKGTQSLR